MAIVFIMFLFFGCGVKPVEKWFVFLGTDSNKKKLLKQSIEGDRIRILCWNIHKENDNDSFRSTLDGLLRADNTMTLPHPIYRKPDIVLFQEVFMKPETNGVEGETCTDFGDFVEKSHGMGWAFAPNLVKNDFYSGVLTASDFQQLQSQAILSEDLEYVTNTPKVSLITTYKLSGCPSGLMVVNVHGINFKAGLSEFKRQMHGIMDHVKNHGGPVILAGDFNTWRLKRLDLLDRFALDMGLEKVEFDHEKQSKALMGLGHTLDHIYISKDALTVVDGRALVIDHLTVSDHSPLYVELKIGRAQE